MIVINFKNYIYGDKALALAKLIEENDLHMVVAPTTADISRIASKTSLNVYAQHVDLVGERSTGFVSPESVRAAGASGVILNHSEHPLEFSVLKKTLEQCKKNGLATLVCVSNLNELSKLMVLKPNFIAFEDSGLIASGKSIVSHKTHQVEKFASLVNPKGIVPLCGAGISTPEDIEVALKLGCKGVLISSAIAASKHPELLLRKLGSSIL